MPLVNLFPHVIFVGLLPPTISNPIAISLGAIAGALSRYYLTLWCAERYGTSFPYGTFVINLSGALVMGFFNTLVLEQAMTSPELRLMIATGFLGSYTTFSTYTLDTANLLRTGNYQPALIYWTGSAVLGILGLEIGSLVAKTLL